MHTCEFMSLCALSPQTLARGANRLLEVGLSRRFDEFSAPALRTESVMRSRVVRLLSFHGRRLDYKSTAKGY